MSRTLVVKEQENPIYPIMIEQGYNNLYKVFEQLGIGQHKICIVSDTDISRYYMEEVSAIAKDYAVRVEQYIIHPGEAYKNLDTVNGLYEYLIKAHFDRNDILIALGGGVVGDLTGFAAATFLRGIRFIQMPTTLLAMVDSSIGGKTGVDFLAYKNMVGAFYQPKAVYSNLDTLHTLTDKQYISGFAEVIKYGLIRDREFYLWLKEHCGALMAKNMDVLEAAVYECCRHKQAVVEADPKEKGERALLNMGHTIGHAVEKLMNFEMLHGECVSVGTAAAAYISYLKGRISMEQVKDIEETLAVCHLPVRIKNLDTVQIMEVTKNDKKMDSGRIKFILLDAIGSAVADDSVTEDEIMQAASYIMQ